MTTSARPKPHLFGSDGNKPTVKLGLTTCGYCHAGNGADRRFCGECGKPLWEKCPACHAECRSGEAFCGGCGINLREFLKQQIDAGENVLATAAACERNGDINEAIRALRSVRLPEHRELTALTEQIATELRRLLDSVERRTHDVQARARDLLAAYSFNDAVRLLESLPKEFQTEESDQLLAEATSKQRETTALMAAIREAVEKKQLLELAPKIQRLLTLQPNAGGVRRLADQVRDRLLVAAKKKLLAFEYKQARELVSRVPECAIDDNTRQLSEVITEFNWLVNDLQFTPIVDPPLLEIAKRFAKKAPGDQENVERCSKLFRLADAPPKAHSMRFAAVAWATPPARSHIGCAVDWLCGSERLKMSNDTAASSWQAEPGRFFAAAGLALQAIDAASVNTNLHKADKQGLFGQLSIGKRKETARRGWGIDIGESSVKVVRLTSNVGDAEPTVDCCDLIPHRISLSRPEADGKRHTLLTESLRSFLAKYPIEKSDRICVSFPSHKILGKSFQLPPVAPKKVAELVQFEAKTRIPIPLDELAWSYHSFATTADNATPADSSRLANTLLIAAKQRDVQELLIVFDELQIPMHVLQSDAVALFNFADYEGLRGLAQDQSSEASSIAILDVGTVATNIVIVTGDRPWFRSFRRGGDDYTNAAVQRLNLTLEQAEQVKIEPTRARRLSELYDGFDPMFSRLTDEIQRSLESFHKETGRQVSRMVGVGGGFRLHGLMRHLRNGP
jgi:Tfp pilus assembly PilM family ATPase